MTDGGPTGSGGAQASKQASSGGGRGSASAAGRLGGSGEPASDSASAGASLSGGEIRTLRKLMQSNERKMDTLRSKIEGVRAEMSTADPSDFMALGDLQARINDLEAQVDALEEEWLEAAEKLGE